MPTVTVFAGMDDASPLAPWADEDNCELGSNANGLSELLKDLSFSSSWMDAALRSARELGCTDASEVTILFEEDTPWKVGEPVGDGICLGTFSYNPSAPSLRLRERWSQLLENPDLGELKPTLQEGMEELVQFKATTLDLAAGQPYFPKVVPCVIGAMTALSGDDREQLVARIRAIQEETHLGFETIRLQECRVWFMDRTVIAVTPEATYIDPKPTDMARTMLPCQPTAWPGVFQFTTGILIIEEVEHPSWKATVKMLRQQWKPGAGWKSIAVIFATRAEAQWLAGRGLRRPSVMGWYRHPTGVYQVL